MVFVEPFARKPCFQLFSTHRQTTNNKVQISPLPSWPDKKSFIDCERRNANPIHFPQLTSHNQASILLSTLHIVLYQGRGRNKGELRQPYTRYCYQQRLTLFRSIHRQAHLTAQDCCLGIPCRLLHDHHMCKRYLAHQRRGSMTWYDQTTLLL
jgi:hypothetical protein